MSNSFMDKFFGPLSKEYCLYFYALSVIFGVLFVFTGISILYKIITNFKKIDIEIIVPIVGFINMFLAYLVNRLLYTMCIRSI
jgi:hypothetical protein